MTFDDLLGALAGNALEALSGFDRSRAIAAGVAPARAAEMEKLHRVYFGPTRTPKQQRLAREAAVAGGFTVDQLVLVEKRLAHVDATEAMRLRRELLATHCTYDALKRRADALVPAAEPAPPKKQVRFTRSRCGMRSVTLTAEERLVADVEHYLRSQINPDEPAAPQMVDPLVSLLRGGDVDADAEAAGERLGVPAAVPRPTLLIPLPAYVSIEGGSGDDIILGLTDGTTMTGADYLAANFGPELEIAVFHPKEGPVNLYRAERFANRKQRDLAKLVTPVCPVPGCRHGADSCEIHHITAWKNGGETNVRNLAAVCRYHNGTNDDDPAMHHRGRIIIQDGSPIWCSPRGYTVPNRHSEFGAMNALFRPPDPPDPPDPPPARPPGTAPPYGTAPPEPPAPTPGSAQPDPPDPPAPPEPPPSSPPRQTAT